MTIRRRSSLDQQRGFYPFFGVNRPFDPEDTFVTARWLSPKVYGGLRLLLGVYGITTVIVDIVLTGNNASQIPSQPTPRFPFRRSSFFDFPFAGLFGG